MCPLRGLTNSFGHLEVFNKQHRKQAQEPSSSLRSLPGGQKAVIKEQVRGQTSRFPWA